jgi:hypothetical protein
VRPSLGVVRINSENLASNLDYCFHWLNSGDLKTQKLNVLDSGISASDVSVIWYRKPNRPTAHPALTDPAAKECSEQEYREFLHSFFGFFPRAKWVNDYWQMQKYSVKANQMYIAKEVGLTVPETVITNDISVVKELSSRYAEIISKSICYAGFGWEGSQYGCFTYVLPTNELSKLSSEVLAYAPAIFQQRINKAQELRVTVIGDEVIACEIQTQPESVENIDWRIENVEEMPHKIVDLPEVIALRLKKMLSIMGLNFGAFDLIADETGTYYFIEVNPNGQYYWMEILTGAPLTEAMVSLILRLSGSS